MRFPLEVHRRANNKTHTAEYNNASARTFKAKHHHALDTPFGSLKSHSSSRELEGCLRETKKNRETTTPRSRGKDNNRVSSYGTRKVFSECAPVKVLSDDLCFIW